LKKKHKLNFFSFKTPKTTYLSSGRIFVPGGFRVLGRFFGFFVIMDLFNKIYRVFSRYFRLKICWNMIFLMKPSIINYYTCMAQSFCGLLLVAVRGPFQLFRANIAYNYIILFNILKGLSAPLTVYLDINYCGLKQCNDGNVLAKETC
jgi:hypothetical protein